MSKYYLVTLRNGGSYDARDLRSNGIALASLHSLIAPGRLEFLARPTQPLGGGLGNFRSMTGITTEIDVIDPAGGRCTLSGRVISVTARPRRRAPVPPEPPEENVAFYYQSIVKN
jgi:hypothetical protein